MFNTDKLTLGAKKNFEIAKDYLKNNPYILKAWVFGSYARGEETKASDMDILIEFIPGATISLFNYVQIINDLEDLLEIPIDLVERGQLFNSIAPYVEKDKFLIYERS